MKILNVGIDVGYKNTKGENYVISSGNTELQVKPPIDNNTLEWNGRYFSTNESISEIPDTKINEKTLINTMVMIAKELCKKGIYTADIRLALGLPLTRMGISKQEYIDYMLKNRRLTYKYEGKQYSIFILTVDVFPQGYAAVIDRLDTFSASTIVIDMGGWTIDILPIIEGQPNISQCKSLSLGTITAINDINERLRQRFNGEADEAIIKEIMMKGTSNINKEYLQIIQDGLSNYAEMVMNNLRALKFNFELSDFVFIGGGALIMKNFCREIKPNMTIIDDVCINAKGYKAILDHKYKVE